MDVLKIDMSTLSDNGVSKLMEIFVEQHGEVFSKATARPHTFLLEMTYEPKRQQAEFVDWESVRRDCKYPEGNDNDGYIYGINLLSDDHIDIVDVLWFKSSGERNLEINKSDLEMINYMG